MKPYINVIGGGLAGLTAANALADAGCSVVVLEQSAHLGGRAATQREGGFAMNLGPHALYCGGPAMQALRAWNIPFTGHPPAFGVAWLVYQGDKYPMISDAMSLMKSPLFGVGEKIQAANLLRLFTAGRAEGGSMRAWIDAHARSEKVRQFAAAMTRLGTYTADMEHLSAPMALRQIAMAIESGVDYIDGGWQTLIDGLADRARGLGVEIRCGSPVSSIAELGAEGIVLAVPPQSVEKLTGARFDIRPVRAACLDLALSAMPQGAATFGLGIDRPFYYSVHSAAAKLAPERCALIHLAKYGDGDRAELEQFADLLMPGWRDAVVSARFLPEMTVSYAIASPEGRPAVDAVPGVAICGDWLGGDGLLADASVASAMEAARVVQKATNAQIVSRHA
jgi:phytoene dehydrogenase-like protein